MVSSFITSSLGVLSRPSDPDPDDEDLEPIDIGASGPLVTPGILAVVPAGRVYVTVRVMTCRTQYGLVLGVPRAGALKARGVLPSALRVV